MIRYIKNKYNNKNKINELDNDKLKAFSGDRKIMMDLWIKYSKIQVKTREEDEFCRYLYSRLSEFNPYYKKKTNSFEKLKKMFSNKYDK